MPLAKQESTPLKYVVGIDIAKNSFVACLGQVDSRQCLHFGKETIFENTLTGFTDLLQWVARQQSAAAPLWFVVEATGVYYEELAYFLVDQQQLLSVLLPNKVKHFARSTELKSKTDQLDARLLCRLGLERALPAWQPPTPALRQLRALVRERQVLTKQGAQLKARVHAYQHSYQPDSRTLARLAAQQQLILQQLAALDQDLMELLAAEPELARKLAQLTSIPGIGLTTAILVLDQRLCPGRERASTRLLCRPGRGAAAKRPLGARHPHLEARQHTPTHGALFARAQQPAP
ncbi:IS110 family transposase [Hymenobacter lutimineralis]|uniref:IS110 family transposase n=1 Tax=Hymenobacter lutimineralis TaxID=2606448 RepID=A0A5D6VAT6_9BACT|nr:transposase [Hymenobacter lutimineralis]TYZ12646.1 IS110 family transposase [Hymenobacter lutimineralis]